MRRESGLQLLSSSYLEAYLFEGASSTTEKALTGLENLPRLEKMMMKQCNGSPAKQ